MGTSGSSCAPLTQNFHDGQLSMGRLTVDYGDRVGGLSLGEGAYLFNPGGCLFGRQVCGG